MELVTAPSLTLKKWSARLDIVSILLGALAVMVPALGDMLTSQQMGAAMAVLSALALGAKFIKQHVPVTAEQKVELVQAAAKAPLKEGAEDPLIKVKVSNPPPAKETP